MTTDTQRLIAILTVSVKKRGEIPLTNGHLLNVLKMSERLRVKESDAEVELHEQIIEELGFDI